MPKSNMYSPEVRERAVRMLQASRDQYPSLWAACVSFAPKIGCNPATLLNWVRRAQIDSGQGPGVSSWSWPPWTGCTGSTTSGYSAPLATFRRQKLRQNTSASWQSPVPRQGSPL